jgi:hypothetical protein
MCGIRGELSFDRNRPVSADSVRAMRDQLVRNGHAARGNVPDNRSLHKVPHA